MNLIQRSTIFLVAGCLFSIGQAQDDTSLNVVKLTDKLYKIEFYAGYDVNLVASIGDDGLLLVDTGFKSTDKKLMDELEKLGNAEPAYIITTHEHVDHTGGNAIFGKEPVIIGHEMLKKRMKGDKYILEEYPESVLPEITFTDSLTLYFNGEEIRIIAITGSHTDNDIMVHFTKSGYAYLGDIAYGLHIPSVDMNSGDDSQYASVVKKALDLLPDDTKFVSGHGRDLSMAEMREFQNMLEETINVIRIEMEKGKDVAAMQEENILRRWEKYAKVDYTSTDDWIQNVANGISNVKMGPTPMAHYYQAFKNGGIEAVIATYDNVKNTQADKYQIHPAQLYKFAYFLIDKGKLDDAIEIFEFNISENPELYYLYDGLGEAYWKKGEIENAVKYYNKSLDIFPDNTNATFMLGIISKE
jgi:glyoxylase-like metal-dependent hydrolase (beta-lactamase superfamily II)